MIAVIQIDTLIKNKKCSLANSNSKPILSNCPSSTIPIVFYKKIHSWEFRNNLTAIPTLKEAFSSLLS